MPKRHAILPVKDVNQTSFVRKLAVWLKKSGKVTVPEYTEYVKTGFYKELPPMNNDWFYIRMAAVARRVYMREPSGVGALARRFGGKNKRRGVVPNRTAQASRKIIRNAMQQMEEIGWMKKAEVGRKLTRKGREFMDDFTLGRVRRSRMVTAYHKRRAMEEFNARKRKAAEALEEAAEFEVGLEETEQFE